MDPVRRFFGSSVEYPAGPTAGVLWLCWRDQAPARERKVDDNDKDWISKITAKV